MPSPKGHLGTVAPGRKRILWHPRRRTPADGSGRLKWGGILLVLYYITSPFCYRISNVTETRISSKEDPIPTSYACHPKCAVAFFSSLFHTHPVSIPYPPSKMILLTCLYLQLVSSYRYATAAESGSKCSSSDPDLFNSQFQDYLVGYNLLRGPGSVSGWPLFQTPHKGRSNATNGCRSAKLKNRRGGLVDVRIPPYVDQLESYPEPTIFDTGLATHNSTWRAYVDWRRRRCGLAAPVTNESKYEELYSVLEYPFRFGSGALAYKQEFRRLLENENRFFRIFTVVVSGAMTIRPRSLDQLDPRFVEYLKAALDGGEKLEPVNRLPWRNDNSRWVGVVAIMVLTASLACKTLSGPRRREGAELVRHLQRRLRHPLSNRHQVRFHLRPMAKSKYLSAAGERSTKRIGSVLFCRKQDQPHHYEPGSLLGHVQRWTRQRRQHP